MRDRLGCETNQLAARRGTGDPLRLISHRIRYRSRSETSHLAPSIEVPLSSQGTRPRRYNCKDLRLTGTVAQSGEPSRAGVERGPRGDAVIDAGCQSADRVARMTARQDDRVSVRSLRADEENLLASATHGNVNWSGDRFTLDQVMHTPDFTHYFSPWPGAGDFGFVAETAEQLPVGVAWLRCFTATDPGYGFVDAAFPELSIWVSASQRGVGVGTLLLISLLGSRPAEWWNFSTPCGSVVLV
nr:hypothetical protein BJQ95_01097 [Cryobacterium sp. SO1]